MTISSFPCPMTEFQIDYTVICGQTFRWRRDRSGFWACLLPTTDPLTGRMTHRLVRLWQDRDAVFYETGPKPRDLSLIRDYFRLDVNLPALALEFSAHDPHIFDAISSFAGLRVIRQDPVECLFSFLCSSAAPLYRIRRTIDSLCKEYGDTWPGGEVGGLEHFAFPPVNRLAEANVPHLARQGLGYRARYIKGAAEQIMENGGPLWLLGLRRLPYAEAKAALMTLPGVGEKIADCVCLFSLDKDEAIPVDTHVRKIANRHYLGAGHLPNTKALTAKAYAHIGDTLRGEFGPMAGWAQQYLFFQDLFEKGTWETYTSLYQPLGEAVQPLLK